MPTQTDFGKAVNVLHAGQEEFIIVGGVAAILNGLGSMTYDLDAVKRAAGRPKDLEVLGQLQALLEERRHWPHTSLEEPK